MSPGEFMATIQGSNGDDTITDVFNSAGGAFATSGADSIAGLAGDDSLAGAGGADTLAGGKGRDTINGGAGNDLIVVDGDSLLDADSIDGGGGFDTFDFRGWVTLPHLRLDLAAGVLQAANLPGVWLTIAQLAPGSMENAIGSAFGDLMISDDDGNVFQGLEGADSLLGGTGNDALFGGEGNDSLTGGDGADTLTPGAGADTVDGGAGTDWLSYADATEGVEVVLNLGATFTARGAAGDHIAGVENLLGSAFDDLLNGVGGGANHLLGGAGADTLTGETGDTLQGGDGADHYHVFSIAMPMIVESGNDGARDRIIFDAGAGAGSFEPARRAIVSLAAAIEDLFLITPSEFSSGAGSLVIGNNAGNWLSGSQLDDTLMGYFGDDTLEGGGGNDLLIGSFGADLYIVKDASDVVVAEGDLTDLVQASVSYSLAGTGAHRLTLAPDATGVVGSGGEGDDTLHGNGQANRLSGQAGDDSLAGGDGAETLEGGSGNDFMLASAGADLLLGQAGADTAGGGEGNDTLNGGVGQDRLSGDGGADLLVGGADNDSLLGGADNDTVSGGAGGDTLSGGDGADVLLGGTGDDLLNGLQGADRLRGDDGADVFVLGTGDRAGKRVLDFDAVEGDLLHFFRTPPLDLPPGPLAEARFEVNLSGLATQAFAQLVYEADAGRLWYDSDGTGAMQRELLAILVGAPSLSAADILIV